MQPSGDVPTTPGSQSRPRQLLAVWRIGMAAEAEGMAPCEIERSRVRRWHAPLAGEASTLVPATHPCSSKMPLPDMCVDRPPNATAPRCCLRKGKFAAAEALIQSAVARTKGGCWPILLTATLPIHLNTFRLHTPYSNLPWLAYQAVEKFYRRAGGHLPSGCRICHAVVRLAAS